MPFQNMHMIQCYQGILIFIFFIFIGSFLNVCIYRIPREESIVFPGSHCPTCGNTLGPYELIPVLSWVFLRGRCSTCRVSISPRYPLVELLTGLLATLVYQRFGLSVSFLFFIYLTLLLVVMTFIDLDHQIIPDGLTLLVAAGGLCYLAYGLIIDNGISIGEAALGIVIGGGFFLVVAIISKGGMGGGDIKLMATLGIWFGWRWILMVMFLSVLIGGVAAIILLLMSLKGRKETIPFGPFIAVGAYVTALYGNSLWFWYASRFL